MQSIALPVEMGLENKVVQLYVGNTPILVCAPAKEGERENFHRDILWGVLNELRLPFMTIDFSEDKTFKLGPNKQSNSYQVVGMGYCKMEQGKYKFYGISKNYNIGINEEHLRSISGICSLILEKVDNHFILYSNQLTFLS